MLLTGATRGIGRALCNLLVAEGVTVLAVARDAAALEELAQGGRGQIVALPCDLSLAAQRRALTGRVAAEYASLGGLINNAGIQAKMAFFRPSAGGRAEAIAAEIEVNLTAPLHLSTELLPPLAALSPRLPQRLLRGG
ncbi:SDR family NAD(P)-dependent oxidoreductase [Cribrihabitans pelagius]|uniref:SDR family NAD(P)-dependent oxidoreductase n=1 Tax=Cribrihabitans pelagius TaxID=1765746 RepID=UPI003B5A13BB